MKGQRPCGLRESISRMLWEDRGIACTADYLLEEAGVATVPGDAYGRGGACCIRMSFASAEDDLREALRRMDAAIRKING